MFGMFAKVILLRGSTPCSLWPVRIEVWHSIETLRLGTSYLQVESTRPYVSGSLDRCMDFGRYKHLGYITVARIFCSDNIFHLEA